MVVSVHVCSGEGYARGTDSSRAGAEEKVKGDRGAYAKTICRPGTG